MNYSIVVYVWIFDHKYLANANLISCIVPPTTAFRSHPWNQGQDPIHQSHCCGVTAIRRYVSTNSCMELLLYGCMTDYYYILPLHKSTWPTIQMYHSSFIIRSMFHHSSVNHLYDTAHSHSVPSSVMLALLTQTIWEGHGRYHWKWNKKTHSHSVPKSESKHTVLYSLNDRMALIRQEPQW